MNQENNNQSNDNNQIKNPFLDFQPVQPNQDASIPYLNKEQNNIVNESSNINTENTFEPMNTNNLSQSIIETQQEAQPVIDNSIPQQNINDDHSIINSVVAQQTNSNDLSNLNEINNYFSNQLTPNNTPEDSNKQLLDSLLSRPGDSNQTSTINNQNNNDETKDLNTLGIIILSLVVISCVLLFIGLGIVSLVLCAICFIGGIINIKSKNKLIIIGAILSALSLIIYSFIFFTAVDETSNYLDNIKKESYVRTAIIFINKARSYENKNATINCGENNTELLTYKSIKDENMDIRSPWGDIDQEESYVKVVAEEKDGKCTYVYYVYLTDGKHSIGDKNNPIEHGKVNASSIK